MTDHKKTSENAILLENFCTVNQGVQFGPKTDCESEFFFRIKKRKRSEANAKCQKAMRSEANSPRFRFFSQ